MNKLEEKANELITQAASYGLEANSQPRGNDFVDIRYKTKRVNIWTCISYTEKGRVKIETWERYGTKREKIAVKYLGELFAYVAASNEREAEKENAK